jgi:hypothetical protein
MPILFVPSKIRKVYFLFKDIFTLQGFSYEESCAILTYFFLGCHTISDFVRRYPWSPSVSSMARALQNFEPNRFMRRNRTQVLKKMSTCGHGDFCYAVDDTANPKYGSSIFGSGSFHSSSGPYFGQKVLILVIVDLKTRRAYPISYVFLTGKTDPQHIPGPCRALDLIQEAIHFGFPPLPVAADSWFDSKEFIEAIKNLGCAFAGELKGNRLARPNINPKTARKKLGQWFEGLQRVRLSQTKFQKRKEKRGKAFSHKILFINGSNDPLQIIAVYNRINGVVPFAFYATNDPSMTGAKLWRYSRARWAIEVLFRDLKQSLGFGKLSAGGEGGAHLAVCIPLILLTSIRIHSKEIWESEGGESAGIIIKRHREKAFSQAIDTLVENPSSLRIIQLRARRKNPNQKPTNISGEKISA